MKFYKTLFFLCFSATIIAQETNYRVGVQLQAIDFFGPQTGYYFIHDGWNYPRTKYQTRWYWNRTLELNYWKKINKTVDSKTNLVLGAFQTPQVKNDSNYIRSVTGKTAKNKMFYAVEEKINYSFFQNKCLLQPYVTAGLGMSLSASQITFFLPVGFGANYSISKQWSINLEFNKRNGIGKNSSNWLGYSVGTVYSFSKIHKKNNLKKVIDDIPFSKVSNVTKVEKNTRIDTFANTNSVTIQKEFSDIDADGIADDEDKCPDLAGSQILLGCPDADFDGVADIEDKCPFTKGLITNHGCPEETSVFSDKISALANTIIFASNSFELSDSAQSTLLEIASLFKLIKVQAIEIEGHTDNSGNENANLVLSQSRADACMNFLIDKGVDSDIITSIGYGSMKPLYDNLNIEGRIKNRRIDIYIY